MRNIFMISFTVLLMASCTRDTVDNRLVTFSGSVYDSSNRVFMPNVWVKLSWWSNSTFQETPVDSVITDANGKYSLKKTIDISRFNNEILEVKAVVPNKFISFHDMDHPTVGASFSGMGGLDAWQLAPFIMFEKANLTINLQRTSNDSFDEFNLTYSYHDIGREYWVNVGSYKPNGSGSYTVVTAAGVKTKVSWKKKFPGSTTSFQASTNVVANTANTITVAY